MVVCGVISSVSANSVRSDVAGGRSTAGSLALLLIDLFTWRKMTTVQFGQTAKYRSITEPRSGSDRVQSRLARPTTSSCFLANLSEALPTRSLPLLGSVVEWQRFSLGRLPSPY